MIETARGRTMLAILWVFGVAFVVALFVWQLVQIGNRAIPPFELWRSDFTNLWAAGKLIGARAYETLYDPAAFTAYQRQLFGPLTPRTYSYPPTAFPVASAFSWLPYKSAFLAWAALTATAFVFAARSSWPKGAGPFWLAALTPAGLWNLWVGHYGFLFGAFWLLIFRLVEKRPVVAGAAIGLFVLKPQLALLIPLILIARRDWRTVIASAGFSLLYLGLSYLAYGPGAWDVFFAETAGNQLKLIDAQGAAFAKMSASAATAILDLGGSWTLALTAQGLLAVLGLSLVWIAARRGIDIGRLALLAATATFLILPYSLNYDLTVVAVAALTIMTDKRATTLERAAASLGFLAPQIGIILALLSIPVTSLMLAALAIAQFCVAMRHAAPATAGAARSA